MGRLAVLVTSPRLPAGVLSASAWTVLHQASRIATYDAGSPLALAVRSDGLTVEARPGASAADLLMLAADEDVVWLAADDGDDELIQRLAADVVERAEAAATGPDVEVVVGSFDPVGSRLLDLVEVMDRLRRECPWDREQTHESLVRYLVEETYETVEAIESGDRDHLREELGDLVLQVVFHARIAAEHGTEPFGIDDVAAGIVEKLIRRHPHVFGASPGETGAAGRHGRHDVTNADGVQDAWDDIKAAEKGRASALDGIPPGLPALSLADKVIERAARVAPAPGGPRRAAVTGAGTDAVTDAGTTPATNSATHTERSLGDALFALVVAARAAGLDAEQALRRRVREEMAAVAVHEQRAMPPASREPG